MTTGWPRSATLPGALLTGLVGLSACASTVTRHPQFGTDCDALNANVDCIRVFYGTNRLVEVNGVAPDAAGEMDVTTVGRANANALSLGRADIWLPRLTSEGGERERGETPMARGEAPEDMREQERYVFVTRITASGRERFVSDLSSSLELAGPRSILLFVHGFNVGFEPALIRSAQLAVDLNQDGFDPGTPVLFSWPSLGRMSLSAYRQDGNQADEAVVHLRSFLDILTGDIEIDRINIVAHSMGNRVLTRALEAYAEDYLAREDGREIEFRIVLAAADVERNVFDLVADQIAGLEPNVTIYTSDDDLALGFSRLLNRAARLGETNRNRPYIRPADGYATIDATQVASELFGIGHGYYSDSPFILNDIRCALADVPADARALAVARYAGEPSGQQYFLTLPDEVPNSHNCALRRQYFPPGDERAELPPPAPPPPPPPPPPVVACPTTGLVVYFDWGRADLTPQAQATIDAALERARYCDIAEVLIVGHTDASGSSDSNVVLSQRRASIVREAMVGRGIAPDAIRTEARGEDALARQTPDDVREPLNRRVEVTIRYR